MLMHSGKYNKLVKYLTAALILTIPLYPKFPLINIPGTFVSVRMEDFLILLVGLAIIPATLVNLKKLLKDDVVVSIIIFFAVGTLSVISAIYITKTVVPHISLLHLLRRIEYFTPFFLGYLFSVQKKNLKFYAKLVAIVVVYVFIYGVGQRYFSWPIIVTQNEEFSKGIALRFTPGGHINSTFAGHYDLASYLILTLPLLINTMLVSNIGKYKGIVNTLLILIISFGLWLIAFSGSRISVVSYMLSATVGLLLIKKYKAIPVVIFLSLLIFSTSPSLRSRYIRIVDVVRKQVDASTLGNVEQIYAQGFPEKRDLPSPTPSPVPVVEDRSTSIRLNVEWPRAIRALMKNPLLGTGYSSISLATDNDYLRVLGETGISGFFAFLTLFTTIFIRFLKKYPFHKSLSDQTLVFVTAIAASTLGIFINAFFIDIFEASKFAIMYWLLMGIALNLMSDKKYA